MGGSMPREGWVDIAKGIAIILVVLFHAVIFLDDIELAGGWAKLSGPLDTFRMPLFFFTTGLFAQRALAMRFTELLRARVAKLVWLYALWTLLWCIVFEFLPLYREVDVADDPLLRWLLSFVWPNESTWFIYALGVYFIVAWLLRRLHPGMQIALAAVLSAVSGSDMFSWDNAAVHKSCMYFVFYLVAVHLGRPVRAVLPRMPGYADGVVAVGYAGALLLVMRFGLLSVPGARLALGALGVSVGVAISVVLSRSGLFGWVDALGKRTLPVYLVHFYVVLGSVALLAPLSDAASAVSWLWVPLVMVVAIALALVLHRMTRAIPGLWDLPGGLWRRPSSRAPQAQSR